MPHLSRNIVHLPPFNQSSQAYMCQSMELFSAPDHTKIIQPTPTTSINLQRWHRRPTTDTVPFEMQSL